MGKDRGKKRRYHLPLILFKEGEKMKTRSWLKWTTLAMASMVVLFSAVCEDSYGCQQDFPMETPLWVGPYDKDINPDLNIAYPDPGAVYWSAKCTIPEGAQMQLMGKYPHSRYISISSYDLGTAAPTDILSDNQINPDPGSRNPFLPGAVRFGRWDRDYTVTIINEYPPEDPATRLPNTLYAKAGGEGSIAVCYRIYVLDRFGDITGGVGLPEPRVILANGDVLEGQDAYDALNIDHTPVERQLTDLALYEALRSGIYYGMNIFVRPPVSFESMGVPVDPFPTGPDGEFTMSTNPPSVYRVFSSGHFTAKVCLGANLPTPPRQFGQYANLDNEYMAVILDRVWGEIIVVRGKAPTTPRTQNRNLIMHGDVDMRYWSITSNESGATTKMTDGVYDEQIPVDPNGYYTVVCCMAEDRPWNSYLRNRVAWLNFEGDGAGDPDIGKLLFRHMLPSPDFEHAIQNVEVFGTEPDVLGEYMPVIQYMTKTEFEELGFSPWKNLP